MPIETFKDCPMSINESPSAIVKGIVINPETKKLEYYQLQDDMQYHKIDNVIHIKSPVSVDLAGDALSWPIIPLIELLNYLIDLRRIKNARIAAPSVFVEMDSDDQDTVDIATDIVNNYGVRKNFAHDKNIKVYTVDPANNGSIEDAILSVETTISELYNPAVMFQRRDSSGSSLSGSNSSAERMVYAQSNTFLSWLDFGFSTLLQKWLDINGFVGYTAKIEFSKLKVDETLLKLQTATDGYNDKSLTRDERRALRGAVPADDDINAQLDEEFAASAMPMFFPTIGDGATIQNSNPPIKPNPALPIVDNISKELKGSNDILKSHIYSAMGIKIDE
jgi:hypothetical protein